LVYAATGDTILTANQHSVFRVVDLTDDQAVTLLAAKVHSFLQPSLCDASTVVVSGQAPGNTRIIYRMQLDGSAATQITAGPFDLMPECTYDGKWLFYWDNRDRANPSLMRLSLKGGTARMVAAGYWFNLSPDGKLLATSSDDGAKHLRVLSTETLQEVHNFPLPADASAWVAFFGG